MRLSAAWIACSTVSGGTLSARHGQLAEDATRFVPYETREEWELYEAASAPLVSCGPNCDAMRVCDEEERS